MLMTCDLLKFTLVRISSFVMLACCGLQTSPTALIEFIAGLPGCLLRRLRLFKVIFKKTINV